MKNKLLLITILFASTATYAQRKNVTTAIMSFRKDKFIKAEGYINKAVKHDKTKESAKTWIYRAKIYASMGASKDEKFVEYCKNIDVIAEVKTSISKTKEFDTDNDYKSDILKMAHPMYVQAFNKGMEMYNTKSYAKALEYFTSSQEFASWMGNIDSVGAFNAALAAQNAGNTEAAILNYKKCVEYGSNGVDPYLNLNALYTKNKNKEEADKIMELAKAKFPNEPKVVLNKIIALINGNKGGEAIVLLKKELEAKPNDFILNYYAGTAYSKLEKFSEAKDAYLKALSMRKDDYGVLYDVCICYNNMAASLEEKLNDIPLEESAKYDAAKANVTAVLKESLPYFEKAYQMKKKAQVKRILNRIYVKVGMKDKVIK